MKKRDFIKVLGLGTLGTLAWVTGIAGCFSKGSSGGIKTGHGCILWNSQTILTQRVSGKNY